MPGITDVCTVKVGQQLTKGSIDPHELLRLHRRQHHAALHRRSGSERLHAPRASTSTTSTSRSSRARCCAKSRSPTPASSDVPARRRQVNRYDFEEEADARHARGRRSSPRRQSADPRHHQGLPCHRVVPVCRLVPGDHQGPDRRRNRGQGRPPRRPEGERHPRQADSRGHGPQALPRAAAHLQGRAHRPLRRERRPAARVGTRGAQARPRDLLPQPQEWSLDGEEYLGGVPGDVSAILGHGYAGSMASQASARGRAACTCYDDLGVSASAGPTSSARRASRRSATWPARPKTTCCASKASA